MNKLFSHVFRRESENAAETEEKNAPDEKEQNDDPTLAGILSSRIEAKRSGINSEAFPAIRAAASQAIEDPEEEEPGEPLPALFFDLKKNKSEHEGDDHPDEDVPDLFAGYGISEQEARIISRDSEEKAEEEKAKADPVDEGVLFEMIDQLEEENDDYRRWCDEVYSEPSDSAAYDPYNTGFNNRGRSDDDVDDIPSIPLDKKYDLQ